MGVVEEHATEVKTDFIVYTSNFCGFCNEVKKFLPSKNISFTEFNLDEHPGMRKQVVDATGHSTVPIVIDIRGETPVFIGGFVETRHYFE